MSELLSVSDAAELLALSPQSVRRAIRRGELPMVMIGRRVLIRRADLESFIQARRRWNSPRLPDFAPKP